MAKPVQPISARELGPLQQRVLDYIWEHPRATARDCLEQLNAEGSKDYAYTTIKTVLDTLHRKRLVSRRRTKTAYHFTARRSRQSLLGERIKALLGNVGLAPKPVASSLVDYLSEDDPEQLEALIAELKERKLL